MQRTCPYGKDDLAALRSRLEDLDEVEDWNEDTIQFVCEEVLPLEHWRVCFVHSYIWQHNFHRDREGCLRKTCAISRGRLVPSMLPLFEPEGARTDFSVFVFFVHKHVEEDQDRNHWSALVLYYEEELLKYDEAHPVAFYHYDSLSHHSAGNRDEAQRAAGFVYSHLLFTDATRRSRAASSPRGFLVFDGTDASWPKQSPFSRSCGMRSCVAAFIVGLCTGSQALARTGTPLDPSCVTAQVWYKAQQELREKALARLDAMKSSRWKEVFDPDEGGGESLDRWASGLSQDVLVHKYMQAFLQQLDWKSRGGWHRVHLYFSADHSAVYFYFPALRHVDVYARDCAKYAVPSSRADLVVAAHSLDLDGSFSAHLCKVWILRVVEYVVRTGGRTRLLLSTSDARLLLSQLPRNSPEVYGASRVRQRQLADLFYASTISPPRCFRSLPGSRPEDVPPCKISLATRGRLVHYPADFLAYFWHLYSKEISGPARSRVPFIVGSDYQPPMRSPDDTSLHIQLRLSDWEVRSLERAWDRYCDDNRAQRSDPANDSLQPVWSSEDWIVCVISYLIYELSGSNNSAPPSSSSKRPRREKTPPVAAEIEYSSSEEFT